MIDIKSQACESFQHADCDQSYCECECHENNLDDRGKKAIAQKLRYIQTEAKKSKRDINAQFDDFKSLVDRALSELAVKEKP